METDIYQKIERVFGDTKDSAIRVIEVLDAETKGLVSDRLIRAILYLSGGDIDKLHKNIESSRLDYRDILYWAEYDENDNQRYDFSKTFHYLGLL